MLGIGNVLATNGDLKGGLGERKMCPKKSLDGLQKTKTKKKNKKDKIKRAGYLEHMPLSRICCLQFLFLSYLFNALNLTLKEILN